MEHRRSVSTSPFENDVETLGFEVVMAFFVDVFAIFCEGLFHIAESFHVFVLDENFDGPLQVVGGEEHRQIGDLLRSKFGWLFFFQFFLEESYFGQRIALFQAKAYFADSNTDSVFHNAGILLVDSINDFLLGELFLKQLEDSLINAILDEVVELFNKFIDFPFSDSFKNTRCSLEVLPQFLVPILPIFHLIINIFNFLKNIVSQFDVVFGILKHLFTNSFEIVFHIDFLKDIADHELNSLTDQVEIVVFVEFISAVEDVVHCLHVFCWVADLIIDYTSLIHQQFMVNKYVFGSQVEGIATEVVQLIHIYSVFLVADELKFPRSNLIGLSSNEGSDPLDLVIFQKLFESFLFDEVHEENITGQLVTPFGGFLVAFFVNLCDNAGVKSVAVGTVTYIMEQACQCYCQQG